MFLAWLIGFVAILGISTVQHESVHKLFFEWGGCTNISVKYMQDFNTWGMTSCNDPQNYDDEGGRFTVLHGFNEVMGYNVDALILAVMFGFGLLIFARGNSD